VDEVLGVVGNIESRRGELAVGSGAERHAAAGEGRRLELLGTARVVPRCDRLEVEHRMMPQVQRRAEVVDERIEAVEVGGGIDPTEGPRASGVGDGGELC